MNGVVLSAFLLFALPCALGLQCYSCKITSPLSRCTSVSNSSIVNCTGLYDACVTTALEIKIKIGGKEMAAYTMTCGQKAVCDSAKEQAKEQAESFPGKTCMKEYIDNIPGADIVKYGVECCQTPLCNTIHLVTAKPIPKASLAAHTSASLVVSGISLILGFVMYA